MRTPLVRLGGAVLAAGLSLTMLAACGSDEPTSSGATTTAAADATTTTAAGGATTTGTGTTTATNAELCAARSDLSESVKGLRDIDIVKTGTSGIQTAVTGIKEDLQAVRAAATAELQPEVKAAEDALGELETALKNAGSGGVAGVVTAATAFVTSAGTLVRSLEQLKCD